MIYLAQLMCKQRHPVVVVPFDASAQNFDEVIRLAAAQMAKSRVLLLCSLCGSDELKWECEPSRFGTMKEITGPLRHMGYGNHSTDDLLILVRNAPKEN